MSKGINITPIGVANGGKRNSTLTDSFKIGPTSIKFVTVIIVALVTLFYLAQVQLEGAKKLKVTELTKKQENLDEENKRLETEVVRLQSIQTIKKEAESLDMVPVQQVNYLETTAGTVATQK